MINHILVGAIATNCWILPASAADQTGSGETESREGVVIDPGADAPAIIARLQRLRLRPRYIILTHGHFDHIAALPDLVDAFAGAGPVEIAIHRDDGNYLGPGAYELHRESFTAAAGNAAYVDALWKDLPSPTRLLSEGDTIGPFRVLHLSGHSPGSAGFLLEGEKILFSGDTLFKAGVGRTDLPGGDWPALQKSLARLLALDPAITVYPGHGPRTSIGEEQTRDNWFES
ncbi:MAG: MBL fold metallo-hydrolase [Spirochaetaceae bacterium]|jgi:glyoxylase-like metal-dependent hydrolase (beta-lactamase superfamily II)|nr:MBL fold metallo-hydrolase [Spirochaetaceae bacterium]